MESAEEFERMIQSQAEKFDFTKDLSEGDKALFDSAEDKFRRSATDNSAIALTPEENRIWQRYIQYTEQNRTPG